MNKNFWSLIKHFKPEEFACPCCGRIDMDLKFLVRLDWARSIADVPFRITSGFRCPKHNKEIGGRPNSSHLRGLAADIACSNSEERYKIINALIMVGFKRIGIADSFIHVDYDLTKPQEVIWVY